MKVNLTYIEIPEAAWGFKERNDMEILELLGSEPRFGGSKVEYLVVPPGKVWLFPYHSDNKTERLEKRFNSKAITVRVTI